MGLIASAGIIGLCAISAFPLWYFASPRWAVISMRSALAEQDYAALATMIDQQTLQVNLEIDLQKRAVRRPEAVPVSAFECMGAAMNAVKDAAAAMETENIIAALVGDAGVLGRGTRAIASPGNRIERDGLASFTLRMSAGAKRVGDMTFHREGARWMLDHIALVPPGSSDRCASPNG